MQVQANRDRTPIRHHRPSVSRGGSYGRPEMLLAYAAEQTYVQQPAAEPSMTILPSQSAPTTPQMYPQPPYDASATSAGNLQGGYFPQSVVQPSAHSESEFTIPQAEEEVQIYYSAHRTIPHGSMLSTAGAESQENRYMGNPPRLNQQPLPSMGPAARRFPPVQTPLESSPAEIEIMPARPKPQCWDHGCNGRQFSTFSNLLRHQREKSGSAMKAVCPYCGTEFTRTTARNGHMSGGKCKGRPEQQARSSSQGASTSREKMGQ